MTDSNAGSGTAASAAGRDLVIVRMFDAPRELVWRAWTQCDLLKRWWGPKGFTTPYCKIDLRIGGKYLCCMRSAEGKDYWSTGVYREIARPERLVCTDCFSDKDGNAVSAAQYGMTGDWPDELLITVTLEAAGNKTKMTLRHAGLPPGEDTEKAGVGWNESFDKLAESLK